MINVDQSNNSLLRGQMIIQRKALSPEKIKEDSHYICKKIIQTKILNDSDAVMVYFPYNHEVDIKELFEYSWAKGKTVAFPKIIQKHVMKFYVVDDYKHLEIGSYNIMEPTSECSLFIPNNKTVMIVPGTVFYPTQKGIGRIGYGGGYYDCYLEKYQSKITTLAVAYDFQIVSEDDILQLPHDQYIDHLITPTITL